MTPPPPATAPGETLAVCTIVSKNYLAYARVLAESLRQHHPDSHCFVLLVDRVDGAFDPRAEPFTLIEIEQLAIPDLPRFCFQYNVLELNTAAKPYVLAHIFEKYGAKKVIYLDPDIMVCHDLTALSRHLDTHAIVLTPHMTAPLNDERHPNELDILKSGSYNLGFIALSRHPATFQFLQWWQTRLYTGCQANFARGLFVDQRWVDLVPGCFEGVHILRDPGYNVAYWNLHERTVRTQDGQPRVNGGPLHFFHFSGYNPLDPGSVSKYQERFTMDDVGDARQLFDRYGERLTTHGFEETRRWPYAFDKFDNGVKIPDLVRRIYLKLGDEVKPFGNPFAAEGAGSFFTWLKSFQGRALPPLLAEIQQAYPDLMQVFPKTDGKQKWGFLRWALREAKARCDVDEAFLDDVRAAVTARDRGRLERRRGQSPARPFGVNLWGPVQAVSAEGDAARAVVAALEAARIPHVVNEKPHASGGSPYAVNLVIPSNDPETAAGWPGACDGRHNVAYWSGEPSALAGLGRNGLRAFDEVWAPSTFALETVAAQASIPVRWVPFPVTPSAEQPRGDRACLGLPADAFVFLCVFDATSIARANPLAAVEAFAQAFKDRKDVCLVLKTAPGAKAEPLAVLQGACAGLANVRLIEEACDLATVDALFMQCDAYVSLHRIEALGRGILQAMRQGKPVIATGYSATEDFLNEDNSLPVRHRLVEIEREPGTFWAEPEIEHAAEQMQRLVADRELAQLLGTLGQEIVERELSAGAIGELVRERLGSLLERPRGDARPAFSSANVLDGLQELRDANLRLPDREPTFGRRLLGAFKKMARHLLPPILDRQAVYNAMVFDAVARLAEKVEEQQREVTAMTRRSVQERFRARRVG